ncbi:hypothetical protein HY312_00420 [Candidatus Saccharibacteria bacterium]|nr:hypothetical protein [Candidatus Saccharibacteria bacterium]
MVRKNNNHITTAKPHFKIAIATLILPTVFFLFSLLMLMIINLIFNPTFWMTGDTEPVYPTPVAITILNILFLTTGAAGAISFLPGIITGIFLLTRSKNQN